MSEDGYAHGSTVKVVENPIAVLAGNDAPVLLDLVKKLRPELDVTDLAGLIPGLSQGGSRPGGRNPIVELAET